MLLKRGGGAAALVLACLTAAAGAGAASADGVAVTSSGGCPSCGCTSGGCPTGDCGSWFSCCPKYIFTIEKPPIIRFRRVCSKPVCEPCDLEGYGYFPTCWRPWAYPPNYSACPVPPPAVLASQAPPMIVGVGPAAEPSADEPLPAPKKTANPNPNR